VCACQPFARERLRLVLRRRPHVQDTHRFEKPGLQFRAEIFNLLDRTNLNTPNLIVFPSASATPAQASPAADTFTQALTTSRRMRFGLKLLW
jgi:hypothetical protein